MCSLCQRMNIYYLFSKTPFWKLREKQQLPQIYNMNRFEIQQKRQLLIPKNHCQSWYGWDARYYFGKRRGVGVEVGRENISTISMSVGVNTLNKFLPCFSKLWGLSQIFLLHISLDQGNNVYDDPLERVQNEGRTDDVRTQVSSDSCRLSTHIYIPEAHGVQSSLLPIHRRQVKHAIRQADDIKSKTGVSKKHTCVTCRDNRRRQRWRTRPSTGGGPNWGSTDRRAWFRLFPLWCKRTRGHL